MLGELQLSPCKWRYTNCQPQLHCSYARIYLRASRRQSRIWFLSLRIDKRNRGRPPEINYPSTCLCRPIKVLTEELLSWCFLLKRAKCWGGFELTFNYGINYFAWKFCHTLKLIKSCKAGSLASHCSSLCAYPSTSTCSDTKWYQFGCSFQKMSCFGFVLSFKHGV